MRSHVFSPDLFHNMPCPTYPEIRLALLPARKLTAMIEALRPAAIHISTEGPLGQAARRYCRKRGLPFTTAYHTRFPEYIEARFRIPVSWSYRTLRRFHAPSHGVMVATGSIQTELESRGFTRVKRWSRGVDTELFRPGDKSFLDLPRPIHLCVGRVAVEKNLEDFLKLDLPGSKVVVGDGPLLPELRRKYPDVHFAGEKHGEELAAYYAASDVFVFPSRTDTFGLVLLEAMASRPAGRSLSGARALGCGRWHRRRRSQRRPGRRRPPRPRHRAGPLPRIALTYSWPRSAEQFLGNLQPFAWRRTVTPCRDDC